MFMRIAVCDDNRLLLRGIEELVLSLKMSAEVSAYNDLETFLCSVSGGKVFDAVLMDIHFAGHKSTGMDAAEELYKLSPRTKIIYVTGNIEYAQQVFLHRSNLSGFLTKPVDAGLLEANLQKIACGLYGAEEPMLMLKQGGGAVAVPLRDIYYIESKGRTAQTYTSTGDAIVSYQRLSEIMQSLSEDFYQCHKSYIVNMRQIRRLEPGAIILKSDGIVPVSRSQYKATKEAYFNLMGQAF